MEQYIPKSILITEIERRQNILDLDNPLGRGGYVELECFKKYLNTFEAKEVNLDEEIRKEIDKYYDECEKKLYKMKDDDTDISFLQLDSFAKHFFELGLKTQNESKL